MIFFVSVKFSESLLSDSLLFENFSLMMFPAPILHPFGLAYNRRRDTGKNIHQTLSRFACQLIDKKHT